MVLSVEWKGVISSGGRHDVQRINDRVEHREVNRNSFSIFAFLGPSLLVHDQNVKRKCAPQGVGRAIL